MIAIDRADRRVIRLLELAHEIHVPAGALAQAWRNPARQVRLVRVVSSHGVVIHPLDAASARAAGQLCAATATSDVVDASVVLIARITEGVTVTSDAGDLRRLDHTIDLVSC
ncbi:MAG: hypothetical protein M3381_06840 [Actinomycetota bacterium]|nr:hypothetical protein [Actinomycetota bacterium]